MTFKRDTDEGKTDYTSVSFGEISNEISDELCNIADLLDMYMYGSMKYNKINLYDLFADTFDQQTRLWDRAGFGAEKYGASNWRKCKQEDLSRFWNSAKRHFASVCRGDDDEDHAAALVFNLMCIEYLRNKNE